MITCVQVSHLPFTSFLDVWVLNAVVKPPLHALFHPTLLALSSPLSHHFLDRATEVWCVFQFFLYHLVLQVRLVSIFLLNLHHDFLCSNRWPHHHASKNLRRGVYHSVYLRDSPSCHFFLEFDHPLTLDLFPFLDPNPLVAKAFF
jgi:hypothetical protein